ncbi:MAG: hypothetical protein VKJ24_16385 [Synechococcales bacterium]|nr:hypothetical protein [Synechococcales bacterium]
MRMQSTGFAHLFSTQSASMQRLQQSVTGWVMMGAIASVTAVSLVPAAAQAQTAVTPALEEETLTGARDVNLPTPPVTPKNFTLPIDIKVVKDGSVTTDTPITDSKGKDLAAWAAAVSACLKERPVLVRQVGDQQVPFKVGSGAETIKLNANEKPVCPT